MGSSALISAIMSAEILGVDAAEPHQLLHVARAEQRQVLDELLHRRVEAVALLELQRQAFGEVAGENAGRIEALQAVKRRLDPRYVAARTCATPSRSPAI